MLSVVIPSLNTRAHLETMLSSLYSSRIDEPCEVVVVDMSSTDGTLEMLEDKFPKVSVLRDTPNRGYGAAANAGIAAAKGDYILVCNSDIVFPDGSLQQIVTILREGDGETILGFKLKGTNGQPQLSARHLPRRLALAWIFAEPLHYSPKLTSRVLGRIDHKSLTDTTPVGWVTGAALAAHLSLFERLGGFDEDFFMTAEETDLCRRVWDSSGRVLYVPAVALIHVGKASCADSALRLCWQAQGTARYTRKHFGHVVLLLAKTGASIAYAATLPVWLARWVFRRTTLKQALSMTTGYGKALLEAWRV